ncbi:hypothetical protein, partial [Pseudomonas aeruginosa]|uniref:hypothetical protein n=1 Tax=Pseudomonas aeruginosa TaxID=287 RepID=UPI0036E49837
MKNARRVPGVCLAARTQPWLLGVAGAFAAGALAAGVAAGAAGALEDAAGAAGFAAAGLAAGFVRRMAFRSRLAAVRRGWRRR